MFSGLKNYLEDQISLMKLESIEAGGKVASVVMYTLVLMLFVMFFILLLSFAGAFYLGELYGKVNGFLFITGFYLLVILLSILFRKSIQRLFLNIIIATSASRD